MHSRPKMIEWHSGIGGASVAVCDQFETIAAIDIKREATEIYANNFPNHKVFVRNIETIPDSIVAGWGPADVWWMSPPCQPHTILGKKLDMADSRSASLARMLQLIYHFRPSCMALENVPGFGRSQSRELIIETLEKCRYTIHEEIICPSRWGWPNRRNRYYLVASREQFSGLKLPDESIIRKCNLSDVIDQEADLNESLFIDQSFLEKYAGAIHLADRSNPGEITNCFTSAYGRSATRCGSYLLLPENEQQQKVRRFSPREVLSFLDFPTKYQLPASLSNKKLWPMVGNSLNLNVTRYILSRLPVWQNAI